VNPSPHPSLGPDRDLCYTDSNHLFAGNYNSYLWNTGSTTPDILIKKAGEYWLIVTNEYDCANADTINIIPRFCNNLNIPNVFSPNDDHINDTWVINALKFFVNPTVAIFDRWGRQVFQSRGYASPWDGTYNRSKVPMGTYYYVIYLPEVNQSIGGSVTVLY
jgi:gliding motility-associated-like protein